MDEKQYTVFIMVEGIKGDRIFWAVEQHETLNEAIDHAELIADEEYRRTGIEAERLDD
jgi:hypothetical protein